MQGHTLTARAGVAKHPHAASFRHTVEQRVSWGKKTQAQQVCSGGVHIQCSHPDCGWKRCVLEECVRAPDAEEKESRSCDSQQEHVTKCILQIQHQT